MRYLILGPTEARDPGGTPVPLGGSRLRALLTALALQAGGAVSVEALVDEVWAEDEPPADATAALQALVGRLRKVLGKDAVESAPGGYRLAAARADVDLLHFEDLVQQADGDPHTAAARLREALGLWRGEALADLPDRAAAAARPEALRLTARHRLFEAGLALGEAEELVPELREAVADHPLDERFHAQLLRALRAAGRHADALAAYEEARGSLADQLGTDPGPELRALHQELLAGEPQTPGPAPRGNLKARLTSFVGREADLGTLHADLDRGRLVTLTGPGGSGKTRLSEEAAARISRPDGVWFAELAPLDHPAAVPGAVLNAVGGRETLLLTSFEAPRRIEDPTERLLEHCAHRKMVLVLDNCEHVIEAAAALTATLLEHCPDLTVLATSREPLGVPGELVRPVEPLQPPYAQRLFAERARAVRPDFDPAGRAEDREAIAEICRRLDGLPLAIELAAARLRMLSPRQIADRLDDRFRLLTSGSRTVLPRQQTLRAVVDWSWDLLDDRERALLRRLSVFAGGWTLEAAEAVCGDGPEVLDLLGALVDKSLLVADTDGPEVRYRMLETIHEYAVERAAEDPQDHAATLRRHVAHYRAFATAAEPELRSAEQLHWLPRVEADLDNLRAALHRSMEAADEDDALTMIFALGWFWALRNYRDEGADWCARASARWPQPDDEDDPRFWPRTDLLLLRYFLLSEQMRQEDVRRPEIQELLRRCTELYSRPGPHGARFPGLLWPFSGFLLQGGWPLMEYMEKAVRNVRRYGGEWELGVILTFRLHIVIDSPGGVRVAPQDLAEVERITRRAGDRWILAQVAAARGEMATYGGRYPEARAAYDESIRLSNELGAHIEVPFLMARLAELEYRSGDLERAEQTLDAAEREADERGAQDIRTYAATMRAGLALRRDDVAGARDWYERSCREIRRGSPPPMFEVILRSIEGQIVAAEGDLSRGLRGLAEALRLGIETRCTEVIQATVPEAAARALSAAGEHLPVARLLGASDAWRGGLPRGVPDEDEARRLADAARRALGDARYDELYAQGGALSQEDVAGELDALAEGLA
ncbi:BTAD domain-containing putative transcriptional regulator [Streptomyces sp. NPDC051940]|uniref:BTAD domain-containing putative transcriptional regulator n=1 Tax=Streptomyces sp. NPDC051940 TaxID=3155675 RepID=UPI003449D94B